MLCCVLKNLLCNSKIFFKMMLCFGCFLHLIVCETNVWKYDRRDGCPEQRRLL